MLRIVIVGLLSLLSVTAEAQATNYYFSSSTGNDSNNCLTTTTPCQTIAKANSFNYAANSGLNFLAGDTFTLSSVPLSPNGTGPITVQSYGGSGSCNVIAGTLGGCATFQVSGSVSTGISSSNISNLTAQNLRVLGNTSATLSYGGGKGVHIFNTRGTQSNVTINNVEASGFGIDIIIEGGISNVQVLNSYAHGATVTSQDGAGIMIANGVLSGTVQGNLVVNIGSQSTIAAGSGILITNGSANVLDQFNVTTNNGANNTSCGGPAGNWAYNAKNITFQFNESYNNKPAPSYAGGCDWDGFDLDGGTSGSILQYNYSHGNYGQGFLLYAANVGSDIWGNNTVRYNVSESDNYITTDTTAGALEYTAGMGSAYIYNNTVWANTSGTVDPITGHTIRIAAIGFNSCPSSGVVANNIFAVTPHDGTVYVLTGAGAGNCTGVIWAANDWYPISGTAISWYQYNGQSPTTLAAWQALVTNGDAGATTANPRLTNGGDGGTCYTSGVPTGPGSCPSAYGLQPGSPMIGAGIDLTQAPHNLNIGTRDYYGNKIPHSIGTGYNIGADGGAHQ